MAIYALLVGIDAYRPPINALYGCVADVDAFETWLHARAGEPPIVRRLRDADATRAAFIEAVGAHLGQAGPDDVALLYYAGHGMEEPVPPPLAHLEPSGKLQSLVPIDTGMTIDGRIVRPLADKELAVLLDGVAQRAGHLAVILDCCNSGDADRDVTVERVWRPDVAAAPPAQRAVVAELTRARPLSELIEGTSGAWTLPERHHVTLSACQSDQTAKEQSSGGRSRGVFSVAFDEALAVLRPTTTYRTLLNTVRSRVERAARDQRPLLRPDVAGGIADAVFLDGTVTSAPTSFAMTRDKDGWCIDGGLVHGLRAPTGDDTFVLACVAPDGSAAGTARVTAVEVGWSRVEPEGWSPDDVAYAAVVVDVPFPAARVEVRPAPGGQEDLTTAVRTAVADAIATSGPDGGPSTDLVMDAGDDGEGLTLQLGVTAAGAVEVRRDDGTAVTAPITLDGDATDPAAIERAVRRAVGQLTHVARWERVRSLGGQPSPLAEAVALDVFPATADEQGRPPDAVAITATAGYRLQYHRDAAGTWRPPYVYVDVVNRTDDELYVAVLDLTDRYRCAELLATEQLAPRARRALLDGRALSVTLPAGREIAPGASARDWLLVLVSDTEFAASAFELAALDEPIVRSAEAVTARNTLERLAARAVRRDVQAVEAPAVARWAAFATTLEVVVPTA